MREKLVSIGDDFWIETMRGRRAFKVDGKALRVRETLIFEDPTGHELCSIQAKMLRVKDTMSIEKNGRQYATVKKALITPMRDRFELNLPGGDIEIQGNLLAHEYTFEKGGRKVAEVSKKWLAVADTYVVEIQAGQEEIIILAATVAIDEMVHE